MDTTNARLTGLSIKGFKAFKDKAHIDIAPLTVIVGRNNSGKSSLIQSLLLLKQTLADPRPEVMLRLEGFVDAFNLREITFRSASQLHDDVGPDTDIDWSPESPDDHVGPVIEIQWESDVDVAAALKKLKSPNLKNLASLSGVPWLKSPPPQCRLRTKMILNTQDIDGISQIESIVLESVLEEKELAWLKVWKPDGVWLCAWNGDRADEIQVEMDHFIPHLHIDKSSLPSRAGKRTYFNAYSILFLQPLESLRNLLTDMQYLGAARQAPPSVFRAATTSPSDLGINGELAAQVLHRHQKDVVHFLPNIEVSDVSISEEPQEVLACPMVEAVNTVFKNLSIKAPINIDNIPGIGFRLFFGAYGLGQVGRGLNALLPVVELGLFADPLRFSGESGRMTLDKYKAQCQSTTHIALEEPEAHLHPKVASRLAHWFVSLARANRSLMVETHSDHLVRRLRGLAARAGKGSELEQWLLKNVVIVTVDQDESGCSHVSSSHLTAEGGVAEIWPADFMDESADEESVIYYKKLEKSEDTAFEKPVIRMLDGAEPESDQAP